ncbi:MAG TPA: hypothetical protein VFA94_07440 [Acidimicrobiales bacterium]|nr:hypothetical protein [Acidimicrobiales bacterium]
MKGPEPDEQHTHWPTEGHVPGPLTFEGELYGLQQFGRGAQRARGWKRWVAQGLVVLMLAPLVIGLASYLFRL